MSYIRRKLLRKAVVRTETPVVEGNTIANFTNNSEAFGDSITAGYGVPNANSWWKQLAVAKGITVFNYAISSTGLRTQISELFKVAPVNSAVTRAFFVGFNNSRTLSTDQKYHLQNQAGHRALLATHFGKEIRFPYGDAGATFSQAGSFAVTDDNQLLAAVSRAYYMKYHGYVGAAPFSKASAVANETITFNNVAGTSIAIGTWACTTAYNLSRIKVTVDGVDKITYDPNGRIISTDEAGMTNGILNDAIVINDLTNTSHTVVITFLDGGKKALLDYVLTLKTIDEAKPTPAYVLDMPHMNSVGYSYPGYQTSASILDANTAARTANLKATFNGYPVAYVGINDSGYYDPEGTPAHIDADGVHPTEIGQTSIYRRVNSAIGSTFTKISIPTLGAPSVDAFPASATIVHVSWAPVPGATHYVAHRSTSNTFATFEVLHSNLTATTFTDSARTPGTTYWYRVYAVAPNYNTSPAGTDSATTSALSQLGKPVISGSAISSSQINLSWNVPVGTTSFVLQRATSTNFLTGLVTINPTTGFSGHNDSTLPPNTQYHYRVKAVGDGFADSDWSATFTVTTQDLATLATPSMAGSTVVSPTQINLVWNAVAGAQLYTVERSLNNSTWASIYANNGMSFNDVNRTPETLYYYRVKATADTLNPSGYGTFNGTTPAVQIIKLGKPSITVGALNASQIMVQWAAIPNATVYSVERSPNGSSLWAEVRQESGTQWIDIGLNSSTQYHYRVIAKTNAAGYSSSDPSDVKSATTQASVVTPDTVDAYVFFGQSNLGWVAANNMTAQEAQNFLVTVPRSHIYNAEVDTSLGNINVGGNTRVANGYPGHFGAMSTLAVALSQAYPTKDFYYMQRGQGETGFANQWKVGSGFRWSQFRDDVSAWADAVHAQGKKIRIMGLYGSIGEEDSKILANAQAFGANLAEFVNWFKTFWAAIETAKGWNHAVYKTVVSSTKVAQGIWPHATEINNQKRNFCNNSSNNAVFLDVESEVDYPVNSQYGDPAHLGTKAQIRVGSQDLFNIFAAS